MAKRNTIKTYLTPEDLKLLAQVKHQKDTGKLNCNMLNDNPTVKVGDLVSFTRHTDLYEEPNIGIVVKCYDTGAFYVKVIKRTTCPLKRWSKYGKCFGGNYITSKYYSWVILKSCRIESFIINNNRTVYHAINNTSPEYKGLQEEEYLEPPTTESIDIYLIDENDFYDSCTHNAKQYIYAMINGKFGEFEEIKNINNLKDYKANAVRKARINKLLFQMKG